MQRLINEVGLFYKELPYCQSFVHKVQLISCKDQVAHFELQLEKPHCNLSNTLHGGMATALIDLYTCALLRTAYQKNVMFTTTELKARFLGAAKLGDTILMEARVTRAGRTVAFAEMDILDKATKKILVQGAHIALVLPQE